MDKQVVVEKLRNKYQPLLQSFLESSDANTTVLQKIANEVFDPHQLRIAIFGGARLQNQHPLYQTIFSLCKAIGRRGIDIIQGGGPGAMDAAAQSIRELHGELFQTECTSSSGRSLVFSANLNCPGEDNFESFYHVEFLGNSFDERLQFFELLLSIAVGVPGGVGTWLEVLRVAQHTQMRIRETKQGKTTSRLVPPNPAVQHGWKVPILLFQPKFSWKQFFKKPLETLILAHYWEVLRVIVFFMTKTKLLTEFEAQEVFPGLIKEHPAGKQTIVSEAEIMHQIAIIEKEWKQFTRAKFPNSTNVAELGS